MEGQRGGASGTIYPGLVRARPLAPTLSVNGSGSRKRYTTNTVEPVVFRPSKSRCACSASRNG
jgi:hypothetical protein